MELRHTGPWARPGSSSIDREIIESVIEAFAGDEVRFVVAGEGRHFFAELVEEAGYPAVVPHSSRVDIDTLDAACPQGQSTDVFVLTDGMSRVIDTTSQAHFIHLLKWLGDRFSLLVLEAPRAGLMPGKVDLGPYSAQEIVDTLMFVSEYVSASTRANSANPRLFASQKGLFTGAGWILDASVSGGSRLSANGPTSTYMTENLVLKVDARSESYFERSEVANEARALSRLNGDTRSQLRIPGPIHVNLGRSVNSFVRQRVPGEMRQNSSLGGVEVQSLIELARLYASFGLFHNDIRPWNLLWNGAVPTLIDFSDLCTTDADTEGIPQILALGCTVATLCFPILQGKSGFHELAWNLWRESQSGSTHGHGTMNSDNWKALRTADLKAIDFSSPTSIVSSLIDVTAHQHSIGVAG